MKQKIRCSQFLFALALLTMMLVGCTADNAILYTLRGNNLREMGNSEQAILEYNRAITLDPSLAEAYYNRGQAYDLLGDYEQAIVDFEMAIALNGDWAEAYRVRGRAYRYLGDLERAIEDFNQALALDPNFADAYLGRGYAYGMLGNNEQAVSDYKMAISAYDKEIESSPEDIDAYFGRGDSHYALGNYEQAIQDFDTVIALDPGYTGAYYLRGLIYSDMDKQVQAIQDFARAIAVAPDITDAYVGRGIAYLLLREEERATADFEKAIDLSPDDVYIYMARAYTYRRIGRYLRATQDYDKVVELAPDNADAYYNRGLSYYDMMDYKRAIQDMDRAIELQPEAADAYAWRGLAYYDLADHVHAVQDLNKAIELNPTYADAYYFRGFVHSELGEFEQAIEDFSRAIELDITFAEAYRMRGNTYRAILELDLALLDYERYLELAPDSPERESVVLTIEEIYSRPEEFIEILTGEAELEKASSVTTTSTFVSPNFAWLITYPSDWNVDATDPASVTISRGVDDGLFGLCGVHSIAEVFPTVEEFVDSVIAYEDDYFKERGQSYDILSREKITLSSGLSSIELMVELGPGGKSRRVYFVTADFAFIIDCETYLMDWPRLESTYDQIINSFTLDSALPVSQAATNPAAPTPSGQATSYPPRPILYYGYAANGEPSGIKGVLRSGEALDKVWPGYLLGWSPQGDRFVYIVFDSDSQSQKLSVATPEGEDRTIFEANQGLQLINLARQSVWSPDGSQIALILQNEEGSSIRVAILDVDGEQISSEFDLSSYQLTDSSTIGDLPFVRWSPDGKRLLLGFAELVVLEVDSGTSTIVSDLIWQVNLPDQSTWLPDSESLIYLDGYVLEDGILEPPQLWRTSLGAEDAEQLLSTQQLLDFGLEGSDQYSIHMSPRGSYLALVAINNGNDEQIPLESNVLIFDLAQWQRTTGNGAVTIEPIVQWRLPGMFFSVVWSPDEQELAYLKLSETEETIEALSWSDGMVETVTVINPPDDQGEKIFTGWNMVSWMP